MSVQTHGDRICTSISKKTTTKRKRYPPLKHLCIGVTYERLNPATEFSQARIKVTVNHVVSWLLQDQHILP